jgi:uncharacterized membrane protein
VLPWLDDLALLLRWFHLVLGIAWIGASFYFVWLNNAVRPPMPARDGVAGELWSVHGGAFYRVTKADGAPAPLPDPLHWFRWEAYLTWLSGLGLLALGFWLRPAAMGADLSVAGSFALGTTSLVAGWVAYDAACRWLSGPARVAAVCGLIAAATFGFYARLEPRAALIHVGALLGTWMAANVLFVIIPGQRAMVDALVAGRHPPLERGAAGALRSQDNNYLTFPVLFCMLGAHFPGVVGHGHAPWLVLALFAASALVKHQMNLHERGQVARWPLPIGLLLAALALMAARPPRSTAATGDAVSDARVQQIVALRCLPCHATAPFQPGFSAPPGNLVLETPAQIAAARDRIRAQVVTTATMPLGNLTAMTDEERALIDRWTAP